MIINVDNYVKYLNENAINANQFLILYLVYQGKLEQLKNYNKRQKLAGNTGILVKELEDLLDKGFLFFSYLKDDNGNFNLSHGSYIPDLNSIICTESFQQELIVDGEDAADELFDYFPVVTTKNNITIKRSDGGDVDRAKEFYREFLQNDRIKHKEVLNRLIKARDHGLLASGFPKWVMGKMWEDPRVIEKSENGNNDRFTDIA
jgi:hypothetical protein